MYRYILSDVIFSDRKMTFHVTVHYWKLCLKEKHQGGEILFASYAKEEYNSHAFLRNK